MQWWMLRRNVHVSWLIAILSVAIVAGVVMAQWNVTLSSIVWIVLGVTAAMVVLWRRSIYLLPGLVMAGMIIGLWRGSIEQDQLIVYENLYESVVTVSGKVTDDTDSGKSGAVVMRVGNVSIDGHEIAGKLWISSSTSYDIKRGDVVTINGTLREGFGNFAATMFRANVTNVQRPQPGDVARRVRDWFADAVRTAIPDPQASLGIGYLVGQKRALPPDLSEALMIVGLTHVVVASGYNLTILVRLARRLFVKVSKYLALLSASMMVLAFMAVTGASPSMSRAGLVAGLSLAAWYYGRSFHPLVLLPFAAAITVLVDPGFAWGDLGWQLSFAAFAGVMILAPLLQRYFYGDKKPGIVRQILGETISAYIVTLPILIYAFGLYSNVAVVANVLVLPLVPLAMLLTFIAGTGALVAPHYAVIIGAPANWVLEYMVYVAKYLAGLPWAQGEMQIGALTTVAMYGIIVGVCVYLWRVTKYNLRDSNLVE
ncbi:hypothetical protein A2707_03115 [Candidatus Saccharibacteria bacterium RIFCSPHIGHO2_01_FULL_45_15]|nr:MAG: hypothetical protein A2707_03115 [Candidatus Saccharibacteria bacterium RIFCSPHIGHO2_01_FULL_45_15]OGL28471.1 MAG: hypothetical protein A3C39_02945 [Candidatus Saccharibacteria bacterium RIFCSPHIGHO2_02_FULL_46_12]OGL32508.1 MAG: hypothetical protein A3E76_00455 [Candidatus Saccharibacteria bacterium RIFCSPHIGHO2_12_FULL_44_22]